MSRFVVKFMKDVLGENGRQMEVCQDSMEVDASCSDDAAELAKKQFCARADLANWSLHADRVQVTEAEFPS